MQIRIGDYVVHDKLTFLQYEEFHMAAIKAGYASYCGRAAYSRFKSGTHGTVICPDGKLCTSALRYDTNAKRNVTEEFISSPKGMLKQGDTLLLANGTGRVLLNGWLLSEVHTRGTMVYHERLESLSEYSEDLEYIDDCDLDVLKVQRDGVMIYSRAVQNREVREEVRKLEEAIAESSKRLSELKSKLEN